MVVEMDARKTFLVSKDFTISEAVRLRTQTLIAEERGREESIPRPLLRQMGKQWGPRRLADPTHTLVAGDCLCSCWTRRTPTWSRKTSRSYLQKSFRGRSLV